jgi:hypothetical protein
VASAKPPIKRFSRPPLFPTERDEASAGPEHVWQKKSALALLTDLNEVGLGSVLQKVALEFHVRPLEICSASRSRPIPTARAAVWAYLTAKPPHGPGWSKVRVAEVWTVDPTTVSEALKHHARRMKLRRTAPDLEGK